MDNPMFCYQCQETSRGRGCDRVGVCGKQPETSARMDLLLYAVQGISLINRELRVKAEPSHEASRFVVDALFTTITNANFDNPSLDGYIIRAFELKNILAGKAKRQGIELPDLPEPANTSEAIERQIRDKEGEMMLSRLKPSDYVIALTIPGKMHDSPGLSRHLDELLTRGESSIVFVIGGSLGLGDAVIHRANEEMSMSKMTFPHQLARVMLLEQLYRAMKIRAGERYHK